ncbi:MULTISPECIES: hypothetical protein [Methylomonas]|uniref:hypothetical protein n=1 Tax=Methylomonas TaxID=416 RepID=UPI0007C8FE19|nr:MULTISPECIES: hypothetical protein [Methylomonas]ANE55978.1 hypothetical protein AYM39_12850 [Methylomonas sp. DH-1]WNB74156.1 hypothetical protein RI210_12765 [Methylomonas koyamae]
MIRQDVKKPGIIRGSRAKAPNQTEAVTGAELSATALSNFSSNIIAVAEQSGHSATALDQRG